jgi:hypothetical protein
MNEQPIWEFSGSIGDINYIDEGGSIIYEDKTGVYTPEIETIIVPLSLKDEIDETIAEGDNVRIKGDWQIYRYSLDKCTYINGVLSNNKFHPELSAWFAANEELKNTRPQNNYLSNICSFGGITIEKMIADLCGDDLIDRAEAYNLIGLYHGYDNFDGDPLIIHYRDEMIKRYKEKNS